ncbi:MAG: DNA translocase FtsK [Pseudomonadota bacterium]
MPHRSHRRRDEPNITESFHAWRRAATQRLGGAAMLFLAGWLALAFATFSISDPSLSTASDAAVENAAGPLGAAIADIFLQSLGGAALLFIGPLVIWGGVATMRGAPAETTHAVWLRMALAPIAIVCAAAFAAVAPPPVTWPFAAGVGGVIGASLHGLVAAPLSAMGVPMAALISALIFLIAGLVSYAVVCGVTWERFMAAAATVEDYYLRACEGLQQRFDEWRMQGDDADADLLDDHDDEAAEDYDDDDYEYEEDEEGDYADDELADDELEGSRRKRNIIRKLNKRKASKREARELQPDLPVFSPGSYELPPLSLLAKPRADNHKTVSDEALEQNARMLENVLADFGVRGEIINVHPGPVVTLYELEPAAGVKSSRVIGLADDIARSMSAVAARVAVVPGRNAIGIELPNLDREMVFLRELLGAGEYENSRGQLTLTLGKGIGGEPVFADLARMPHLLIAGTTGSGKSVGINTMILSVLYRLSPDQCKLIMIDPKMLELSVYEGIPHLLAPVVTDPRKAVVALKWTVREMEERYKRMSKVGVRNISGFNERIAEAEDAGEVLTRTVHTGYDDETGEPVYETEELEYEAMPFIVVVIDEVADLMMVAGKDIEGMVQRLAQMARAAGIHLIMATQRPSVDVITGTIKANFPTRISFQVTSKIDSRTILGEQGAEQLLGMGDMLHMAGGGRIKRVHGAFVSDDEVEKIVKFLKKQGKPDYVQEVTEMRDEEGGGDGGFDIGGNTSSGDALYDKAVAIVLRDRKASTSYIQRRLQIGYNRAATLIERMEEDGVISPANHAGKREILVGEDAA